MHHIELCKMGFTMRTRLWADADSEGPDQTVQMRSLIRAFTVHKQNQWILLNVSTGYDFAHVQDNVNSHILPCSKAFFYVMQPKCFSSYNTIAILNILMP